jgi:hypothetical protein
MKARRPQYDYRHRQIRDAWLKSGRWVGVPCVRCGEPLEFADRNRLHLDHAVDRFGRRLGDHVYSGFSHASCNTASQAFGRAPRQRPAGDPPPPARGSIGRVWLARVPGHVVAHAGAELGFAVVGELA